MSPADHVLAHAAFLADLGAGRQAVSRFPGMLRDAPPEFVGDAEVRRFVFESGELLTIHTRTRLVVVRTLRRW
ncbi:hypothetical protein OOK36_18815 [Streptomyces sp. NBC_00365]|uniref:hypothetical protein n=1 Tax=Streptomyces sp. NBC_00365 TaxID=2975726 RepID=UPI0022577EE1|nr:hypothetical protein [Streptomyces sp. NBC_00365]MCX5090912.1 hypothetical protein [Streptomyces sp. NBC_00365]